MENLETLATELKDKLTALESKATNAAEKSEVEALKTKFDGLASKEEVTKLDGDIEALAKKVEGITVPTKNEKALATIEIQKGIKKGGVSQNDFNLSAVIKADVLSNLFVIDGGTFDEDEANLDSGMLTITAGAPTVSVRQPSSQVFFNTVASIAEPLLPGQAMQAAIVYEESGNINVTGEANTKPIVSQKVKIQKVEAKKVPAIWYETTEFVNRIGAFGTPFRNNFRSRLVDRMANLILTDVNSVAATWTLPTGFDLVESANNYDALTAIATFIEANKYVATHVVMNVVDVANMFTAKGLDGHYSLTNGGSIQVINGGTTLLINGSAIQLIKVDATIQAQGTVTMFDVSKLRFGLQNQVDMSTNPYKYWEENIIGMRLEGAFAVLLPENHPNAVVSSTFDTIINAINAPVGSN